MGKIALSLAVSAFLLAPAPSFPQQYPSVPFVAVAFPSQKESTFWTALFTASEKEIFVYNRRSLQIYERFSIDEGLEEVLGDIDNRKDGFTEDEFAIWWNKNKNTLDE